MQDLNSILVPCGDGPDYAQKDFTVSTSEVSAYFKNLAEHLCEHIREAQVVVGCVAWLTEPTVLRELARKQYVSLLVQKEDFLRPDASGSKASLRALYAALQSDWRSSFVPHVSTSSCQRLDPVRVVGVHKAGTRNYPRAHHKFALFGKMTPDDYGGSTFRPYAVWTGSYNWTVNAGASFENAVVIRQPEIVNAYYREYQQLVVFSEPLDWTADYVELYSNEKLPEI